MTITVISLLAGARKLLSLSKRGFDEPLGGKMEGGCGEVSIRCQGHLEYTRVCK